MKKTLLYLATIAAAVSCDLYGGQELSKPADEPGSVSITFSEVKDSSFVVNIAPTQETSYYSYLIDNSDAPASLDSLKLYKIGYSSLAQGTVKWSTDAASKTIKMTDLMPNTTYQVYAVAGSPMGFIGSVVVKSVTTSDGVNPSPVKYERKDNSLSVTFSEPVKVGKGKFSASYYALHSDNIADGVPEGQVAASDIVVATDGNAATITVQNLPDGAFYTVSYEDGAFEDYSGNKIKGMSSSMVLNEATKNEPSYKGLGGRNTVGTFKLGALDPEDAKYATDSPAFLIGFESEYGYGWTDEKKTGSVVYNIGNKTTEYVISATSDFDYSDKYEGVVIALPTAGDPGNTVSMTIGAGAFEDFYGNANEEWKGETLYSYGYTLDDVIGSYSGPATSYFNGDSEISLTIVESDDKSKGNVMLTSYLGLPCSASSIYADFNVDAGTLTIQDWQLFLNHPTAGAVYFAVNSEAGDPVVLEMPTSGILTNPSLWFGAFLDDLDGWYDIYMTCELSKVEETAAASAASGFDTLIPRKSDKLCR